MQPLQHTCFVIRKFCKKNKTLDFVDVPNAFLCVPDVSLVLPWRVLDFLET